MWRETPSTTLQRPSDDRSTLLFRPSLLESPISAYLKAKLQSRYVIHRISGWSGRAESTSINAAQCTEFKIICQFPKSHSEVGAGPPSCGFGDRGSQLRRVSNEMERMAQNGTATFANPDDYQAGMGDAIINLIVTGGGDFNARLTWLNLRRLYVLRACENLPRIAFFSLSPAQVFVSFPASACSSLTYGGFGLQFGDVVFHSRGERMHQRTNGESQWGLISLPPEQLAACGKALTGQKITSPPGGRVLRPSRSAAVRLLRLHSRACRLAETRHELIANPEVARALEQELLHALVNCLTADDANGNSKTRRHHADIMVRFEDALAAHIGRQLSIPQLCADIGVPERTLRMCCTEFLGMGPTRYLLLRRLNMARSALHRANPANASVAEIA
jgi:AraC-like DNA-binding protein